MNLKKKKRRVFFIFRFCFINFMFQMYKYVFNPNLTAKRSALAKYFIFCAMCVLSKGTLFSLVKKSL